MNTFDGYYTAPLTARTCLWRISRPAAAPLGLGDRPSKLVQVHESAPQADGAHGRREIAIHRSSPTDIFQRIFPPINPAVLARGEGYGVTPIKYPTAHQTPAPIHAQACSVALRPAPHPISAPAIAPSKIIVPIFHSSCRWTVGTSPHRPGLE